MRLFLFIHQHLAISLFAMSVSFPASAQPVPDASSCLKVEVGAPANRGVSVGVPGWALNLENTCSFSVLYLGCYSSPSPDAQGRTRICSAEDRYSHIGLNTYGGKPGVYAGGGSIEPGPRGRGSLGSWNPGARPSVSVSLVACPREIDGKQVRFSEVRFENGSLTAKCEIGQYKEVRIIGM